VTTGVPRIELYLRSLAPTTARKTQDAVIERLRQLDDRGRIRGFDVVLCGDCICPRSATADTPTGERLLEKYEALEAWATARDRELVGFEERDLNGVLTGTSITGIVFPQIVLGEFRDGDLSYVAPSTDGTRHVTVRDRLETLAGPGDE
jgi:hypothetical protein